MYSAKQAIIVREHDARIQPTIFIWRLKVKQPDVIELGIDTMVMDNNDAEHRHGVKPTCKKKTDYTGFWGGLRYPPKEAEQTVRFGTNIFRGLLWRGCASNYYCFVTSTDNYLILLHILNFVIFQFS